MRSRAAVATKVAIDVVLGRACLTRILGIELAIIRQGATLTAASILIITCTLPFICHCLHTRYCADFGMWVGWARCARRVVRHDVKAPRRLLSTQAPHDVLSKTTRNIGIVAHIDAVCS